MNDLVRKIDLPKILDKLGFATLSEMQKEVVDTVLHSESDLIVLSPTGTGKTLAYLLPLIQILDPDSDEVQAVVIVPGRELALQSAMVHQNLGSNLRSFAMYGGRMTMSEHQELRKVRPQIVFATPGRLNDHLTKGNLSSNTIRYLVIDEFDKCLEMGFADEMREIIDKLPDVKRKILLSATDADSIPRFIDIRHSIRIDYLKKDVSASERLYIYKVQSADRDKLDILGRLLRSLDGSSIIFLNHRESVDRTGNYLSEQGFVVSILHGGMEQKKREDALYRFANGSSNVFVSTDLASRGLDIPDVDNIIHYHLPDSEQVYIHRVGRTARWQNTGRTFFILGPDEMLPAYIHNISADYTLPSTLPPPTQPEMSTIYIGKGKKDKISKGDVVGFLCRKGGLSGQDIGRIDVKERYTYAAIKRNQVDALLTRVRGEKIKGIKTVVESVR